MKQDIAIIFRSTSLGDWICGIPFLREIYNSYSKVYIFEINKFSNISHLLLKKELEIDYLYLNTKNFNNIIKSFISLPFIKSDRCFVYIASTSECGFWRKLFYKTLACRVFGIRNNFVKDINKLNTSSDLRGIKNQSQPEMNNVICPFYKYDLQLKCSRESCLDLLKIESIKSILNERILQNLFDNTLNIGVFLNAKDSRKIWPIENWYFILRKIKLENKCKIFLLGGESDYLANERFIKKFFPIDNAMFNVAGLLNPSQTLDLLKYVNLYIGNDAAPMHMSALMNCHIVGIFCNWEKFGIWEPILANSSVSHRPSFALNEGNDSYSIEKVKWKTVYKDVEDFINNSHKKNNLIRFHYKNTSSTLETLKGVFV